MQNKMLIDASHPEETRVIVLRGNRVEEFDFESANKKQLRGNIYLAKVTRVEPSLQAAFVDYGGNRHGFLAFSEIHPDYYQIPVADRQALLEEEARAERADEDGEPRRDNRRRGRDRHGASRRRRDASISEGAPQDIATHVEAVESADGPASLSDPYEWAGPDADGVLPQIDDAHAGAPHDTGSDGGRAAVPVDLEPIATPAHPSSASAHHEPPAEGVPAEHGPAADVTAASVADADAAVSVADHSAPGHGHGPADDHGSAEHVGHTDRSTVGDAEDAEAFDTSVDDNSATARHKTGDDVDEDAGDGEDDDEPGGEDDEQIEQIGGDAMEEVPMRPVRARRHYKIQEVIRRRQILLIQVVKEERGTKGAALTTYLSLAGRYSVLMPNTARGGGISRKITDSADRKRLKSIAEELEVPEGMGIILRTAGASRTKAEVKRDFEYLLRMWETVREVTMKSTAPTLVYEEGSLIKRAIRDLYNKDIGEISVAGEDGYREAKEFMRLLMPSHAKNVQPYRDAQPIFADAGAESQLDGMYSNHVTLRSGGYIVINQTEALVAIDVNSGRSTREHNIEDTALRTNLEAADEVARQLRLRDLAGLIVVDFIDMEEGRNNRAVERRMKDALKNDRARIQIGRISHFGLLEMSRQRIRTGVLEGSTVPCAHCMGAGMVRSTSSIALHVLRGLEEALIKNPSYNVFVRTRTEVALYILNQKRLHLRELEIRFAVTITLAADATLTGVSYYNLERGELAAPQTETRPAADLVRIDSVRPIYDEDAADVEADDDKFDAEDVQAEADGSGASGDESQEDAEAGRRRRRRRRRGGRDRDRDGQGPVNLGAPQPSDDGMAAVMEISGDRPGIRRDEMHADADAERSEDGEAAPIEDSESGDRLRPASRRRRRSRRPDFRRPYPKDGHAPYGGGAESEEANSNEAVFQEAAGDRGPALEAAAEPHQPAIGETSGAEAVQVDVQVNMEPSEQIAAAPAPANDAEAVLPSEDHVPEPHAEASAEPVPSSAGSDARGARSEPDPVEETADSDPARPKRSGWWQRAKATFGG